MTGWHHRLNGHEFEQAPGDSKGQGRLAYCSSWSHEESDTTQSLNNSNDISKETTNLKKFKTPCKLKKYVQDLYVENYKTLKR